jgi:hypothetical protein
MGKIAFYLLLSALLFGDTSLSAYPSSITLDEYQNGLAAGWKEKKFKGQTQYTVSKKDGQLCIAAVSQASASGLFYEIKVDSNTMPILSWQWWVDDVLVKGDATKKSGDDYAARVYVVFPSAFFWRTKALNYIWDNKLPKGTFIANAYTKNAMMVVVESGFEHTGKWITEERNIREDFISAFGENPPLVGAIAIMTDTDDTGETAKAWYGMIRIMSALNK